MEFDLHSHSKHSFDSKLEVGQMVETARRRGLNGIAVTDHDSVAGGLEALEFAAPDFMIIPGIEVHSEIGDIIGLFVREPIDSKDPIEVLKKIHAQDGVAILPHPFRHPVDIPVEFFEMLDGIECYNARYASTVRMRKQVVPEDVFALARRFELAIVGVSDAHSLAEIGRGSCFIPAFTEDDVKNAIRGRATVLGKHKIAPLTSVSSTLKRLFSSAPEKPMTRIVEKNGLISAVRPISADPESGEESEPDVFEFEKKPPAPESDANPRHGHGSHRNHDDHGRRHS